MGQECDLMDYRLPGSAIQGIFQGRIIECHFLLQKIFPTPGLNLCLQWKILYHYHMGEALRSNIMGFDSLRFYFSLYCAISTILTKGTSLWDQILRRCNCQNFNFIIYYSLDESDCAYYELFWGN